MPTNNAKKNKLTAYNLTASGVCLALCMLLPFLTGQIQQFGNALSPMHIPVLLCGFICGPFFAAAIGAIAPALRFILFGMPPFMPVGASMCFELAVYGLASGYLYKFLPGRIVYIYVSLVASMLLGRIAWGAAAVVFFGISGWGFSWQAFFAGAFVNAIPGIILHIALIPVIVIALQKAKLLDQKRVSRGRFS